LSKVNRQLLWFWFYYDLRLAEWSNWELIGVVLVLRHSIGNCSIFISSGGGRSRGGVVVWWCGGGGGCGSRGPGSGPGSEQFRE